MATHDLPHPTPALTGDMQIPTHRAAELGAEHGAVMTTTAARAIAVTRISLGLLFAWAFLDKAFGLGYATASAKAWFAGGSPTNGFLGGLDAGPLTGMFQSWGGAWWADALFMVGLAGIAVALLAGIGMRVAAVSGTLMMALMWLAEWPLARFTATGEPTMSTNPLIEYHVVYAAVLIVLALTYAGNTWGFGRSWQSLELVRRNPWLR